MSLKKSFLKSKPICKVTFRLKAKEAQQANQVRLLGEFNEWNKNIEPMKRLKNGDFTQTLNLPIGSDYAFRYWLNDEKWENDWHADKYVPSGLPDAENSVVTL